MSKFRIVNHDKYSSRNKILKENKIEKLTLLKKNIVACNYENSLSICFELLCSGFYYDLLKLFFVIKSDGLDENIISIICASRIIISFG